MNSLPQNCLAVRARMATPAIAAAVVALAMVAMMAGTAPAAAERFTLRGDQVAVYNLAGEVSVAPTAGREIVVEVTLQGPDADRLRVETGTIGEWNALRVIYPGDRVVYREIGRGSNSTLRVHPNGTFGDDRMVAQGRRVKIAGSGDGIEAHAQVRILMPPGRSLRVRLGAGEMAANDVEGVLDLDTSMGSVSCHGTRGSLALDTGSGTVRVSEAQGDVDLDTGSGNVDVSDVRGGEVRIDTGSGSVRVERVRAENLDVDTGSGNVTMNGIDAPTVRVDTGSGSVRLEAGARLQACDIDTGSGSVTVALDERFAAAFHIETGSGGIDVELPHTVTRRGDGYVHGRMGDGEGGGSLKIDTGSGSVKIVRGG